MHQVTHSVFSYLSPNFVFNDIEHLHKSIFCKIFLSRQYKIHTPEEDPFQNSAAFVEKSLFSHIIWPAISKSIPEQRSINVNHVVKHTMM